MEPRILVSSEDVGINNKNLEEAIKKVETSGIYKDLSTVIICPTRGIFPTRVVQSWMKLQKPLNQQVYGPIFGEGLQVAEAYNELVKYVINHPLLGTAKYILTIEEDNLPPVDGLLKLYESMEEYDGVSGLYWGKGPNGFPMIFGDPEGDPLDSKPLIPKQGEVQACNAIPMGFGLFKMDMFRNVEQPWFKTEEGLDEQGIERKTTQDFYFCRKAREKGYKFAVDNRILVGHYSHKEDKVY